MTWPIFFELVLQMLVGNADQFMISRYSQTAVAAIGNSNQVLNVLLLSFGVVNTATVILFSQYKGAGRQEKMNQVASLALLTNMILGLLIGVILVAAKSRIFTWMQVPADAFDEACKYMDIVGSCLVLPAVFMTFSAIFRSNGWLKEALGISAVMNVLNITGNALLIHGFGPLPALGLSGVAYSSNFARFAGILLFIWLLRRRRQLGISAAYLNPFPWGQEKRLLSIGLPAGGDSLSYTTAQVCILRMINTFGTPVVAAGIYSKMFANLSFLYSLALAQSSQILVGYLIGAGEKDRVDKQVTKTAALAVMISCTMSVIMFLLSEQLFGLFTKDPQVIALGRKIMLIDIPLEAGRAVNMVMVRSLQAAGDIRFPVVSGILCVWIVEVTGCYLFGVKAGYGLVGIWSVMAFDEVFRAAIYLWRWRQGLWRQRSLI
ncbi:MAG: MATE family efflux transporter [Clostridiales bacterium]